MRHPVEPDMRHPVRPDVRHPVGPDVYNPVVELACPHICINIRGVSMKGDPQESVFVLSYTYLE